MEAATERVEVRAAPDRGALRVRIATALVHVALAAPGPAIVGVAGLASLLLATGLGSDVHGYATAFAISAGVAVVGPSVVYLSLIRRWWVHDRWRALAIADGAMAAIGARLAIDGSTAAITWPWALMATGAMLGAVLVAVPRVAARHDPPVLRLGR